MNNEEKTLAFIGAGNMAKAIIAGLIKANWSANSIIAVNRSEEKNSRLKNEFGIQTMQNPLLAANKADVIVLGVKPQNMQELLLSMHKVDWKNKLVISMAAGISITRLKEMANFPIRLIRVMPNTPSLVGEGMSGLYAETSVSLKEKTLAENLFKAVGKVCWLKEESEINSIIAAAGSAPAYFFLFMEAMQLEAQKQGFTSEQAKMLVQQAALGAAKLSLEKQNISFTELREQVTSKGGTTEKAIEVFEQANLSAMVAKAMQAAMQRAKEMETVF